MTAARPCMPTRRTIHGCGSDQHARISEPRSADGPGGDRQGADSFPNTRTRISIVHGRNLDRSRTIATDQLIVDSGRYFGAII
jgi:hypothetical protein